MGIFTSCDFIRKLLIFVFTLNFCFLEACGYMKIPAFIFFRKFSCEHKQRMAVLDQI